MKILRFLDARGRICLGQPVGQRQAQLYRGKLFGPLEPTNRRARIAKRLAPVDPPNVYAIGLNYRQHADESGLAYPEAPVIFLKASTSVTAPGAPIILPAAAPDEVDYEAELAIIIARPARNLSPEEAFDCVLGFTCA
ncbi:MAG: fumarylacetoacetate hydrolase family protein, partial [Phycisphaerae bacterium]